MSEVEKKPAKAKKKASKAAKRRRPKVKPLNTKEEMAKSINTRTELLPTASSTTLAPNIFFTPHEIDLLLKNINSYTPEEQEEILLLVEELETKQRAEAAYNDLIEFCKQMQPDYKVGKHHRILANMLMDIERGKEYDEDGEEVDGTGKDRICVNMPPRHGKSQLISIYFPAWFLGRNPEKKVLMVSHTTDLAVDFGRKVRNLISTPEYQAIFPTVQLASDSKSAGRWNTNAGGEYFACGVGSALAGRGAHLLLVDDPHNEQDIINGNLDVFDKAYEWFTFGARTRLMPGGRIAIVQCMTGDTGVMLPDGTEKPLKDVRPGDEVATWEAGELSTARVLNHKSNGIDRVFTIRTTSRNIVKANERHPFLVEADGELRWVRLKHLKPGDTLISLNTSKFTRTQIESITYTGHEEVFDVQIERTENFIANGLVSHNTRWHLDDLTGRVVRDMAQNELADKYEVVEFPAILEVESDVPDPKNRLVTIHKTIEKPLWPEFFNLDALYRTKASMPLFQWNAQYQQCPTAEEAALIKREWWKIWPNEDPPQCEYIIMTLDAAAEKNNRADYTALTTWGVFFNEEENCYGIILLNSIKRRLEFPELKELAMEQYEQWQPDAFIVEKKSSGTPLYQEMRRSGLLVQEYTPHRGSGDKTARLNSVADIVRSGLVWVPQTRWAEELVEEVAGFPFMSHDDLVDTTIMALMRFRQGGFISLPTDEAESEPLYRRRGAYY